jgi:hypothetical protein
MASGLPRISLPGRNLDIAVECARPGYGRRTLRSVPELEVTQDSLDDAGGVGEAHDLERTGVTSAEQRIGFIFFLSSGR